MDDDLQLRVRPLGWGVYLVAVTEPVEDRRRIVASRCVWGRRRATRLGMRLVAECRKATLPTATSGPETADDEPDWWMAPTQLVEGRRAL